MWTSTTSLHICYFYLCLSSSSHSHDMLQLISLFHIAWINSRIHYTLSVFSQLNNQECSSSLAYVNTTRSVTFFWLSCFFSWRCVSNIFSTYEVMKALPNDSAIIICTLYSTISCYNHSVGSKQKNRINEGKKEREKSLFNKSPKIKYNLWKISNLSETFRIYRCYWWKVMIEREMLNSMFSLIVSKTIACVNKMRVNRFNRIENVRHVDKIHTFTNNIKILKSIQFHWIGFTKMAKHSHTHTHANNANQSIHFLAAIT